MNADADCHRSRGISLRRCTMTLQLFISLLLCPLASGAGVTASETAVIPAPEAVASAATAVDSIPDGIPEDSAAVATPADSPTRPADADTLARAGSIGDLPGSAPPALRGRGHLSPGAALGVGLAASVGPAAVAALLIPPGSDSEFAWEAALTTGVALGVLVGPAVGLWCGGRGDLARRGLILRGLCAGTVAAGGLAVLSAMATEEGGPAVLPIAILGAVGGAVCVVSWAADLAITPSATANGRPHRAELDVRPDGKVALTVRF